MQVGIPFFLLLLPSVLLFGYLSRRFFNWPRPLKPRHIAEAATLHNLPSYSKLARRHRLMIWAERVMVILILACLTVLAARPQAFVQKVNEEESRDIVLCLDSSGSMIENIQPALEVMKEIVNENPTDRYAIVLFQTATFPALPLTRDIVAINDTIDDLIAANEEDSYSFSSAGYDSNAGGGTDIGAGLLGCLRRFSDLETPRSRHVIMISDIEHNGQMNPKDSAALYGKYGIQTQVVVPANAYSFDAANANWLGLASAEITELQDGEDFKSVLGNIYGSILNRDEITELIAADNPLPYYVALSSLGLGLGGLRMFQERRKK